MTRLLFRSWETEYAGYHIRVERRGIRMRLLLNGVPSDSRFILPGRNREVPIVSAHLTGSRTEVVIVEAFLRGLKIKIMARGRQIGGDCDSY